jgi:hypothetical protein
MVLSRPRKKKRTQLLDKVGQILRRALHLTVDKVIRERFNPILRGWVNYFRWGNPGRDAGVVLRGGGASIFWEVLWEAETTVSWTASSGRKAPEGDGQNGRIVVKLVAIG